METDPPAGSTSQEGRLLGRQGGFETATETWQGLSAKQDGTSGVTELPPWPPPHLYKRKSWPQWRSDVGRALGPQNYPGGFPPLMEMAFPLQPRLCPVTSAQGELGLREPRITEVDGEDTARAWRGPGLSATTDPLYDWTSLLDQPFSGPQFPTRTRRQWNQVTPPESFSSLTFKN